MNEHAARRARQGVAFALWRGPSGFPWRVSVKVPIWTGIIKHLPSARFCAPREGTMQFEARTLTHPKTGETIWR